MGYMRHHAIVVTSWDNKILRKAHKKAKKLFKQVAPITPPAINGYVSFLIAPDGSKENWLPSDHGDEKRREFIEWTDRLRDEVGFKIDYVEIQFGDERRETKIISHSDNQVNRVREKILDAVEGE